ncbi:MAG: DUF192 domain-containing protein [Opitutaceae bacterium]
MKNANPVSCTYKVAVVASALLFSACGQVESAAGKSIVVKEPKSVADWFTLNLGGKSLRMQLAVRPKELEHGLMDRRDLGVDDAMVFVFERSQPMSFWMRNTPTPLDIAYFSSEGVLMEYYPAYPFDEKSLSSRSQRLQFVVETNQGWFRTNGIKPGARLDLKALGAALTARGFDPRKFGLEP